MQERILIAPNGIELLRTLAGNGVSTLGLRIMQPAELARFALMRSGIAVSETQIMRDTEATLIWRFLPELPYFQNASYRDAQNLANALRMLRLQITADERSTIAEGLKNSSFTEKNEAITNVYDKYMAALRQENMTDTVCILRRALRDAKPLNCTCTVLREYPLSPLEQALAAHLSGGNCRTVSLCELLQTDEKPLAMPQITEAYGAANEVEAVIGTIYQEKLPLDHCTVAVTDTAAYALLMFEYASRYAIPVTFGCGLPVTLTQAANVLRDYQTWITSGHFGIDALRGLLCGPAFDTEQFRQDHGIEHLNTFINTAGAMRLGTDSEINRARIEAYCSAAKRDETLVAQLKEVFINQGMRCDDLIRNYAKIRKNDLGRLDSAAKKKICDTMEHFSALTEQSPETLISDLLQTRVCPENSREGALHITTISGALSVLRKNLFVMGLSAEQFPGAPSENYLLLDDEFAAFGASAPTSLNRIRQTQNALHDLLKTASSLESQTALSYTGFDTAELKANNASSVLYALYLEAGGTDEEAFKNSIRHTGYFSQDISGMTEIGRAYLNGVTVAADPPQQTEAPEVTGNMFDLSPSMIEEYVKCPKKFCCHYIMHIKEPESDDVFSVISPADFGNLVHEAMAFLVGRVPDEDAFLVNAEQIFARYLTDRPPMNPKDAEKYRYDFIHTVRNGFERAEDLKIEAAEEELTAEYDCGIKVKGRTDAIAVKNDGSRVIIDYKTGQNTKHEPDDVFSCIQVMMYADMLQKKGMEVAGGEYWYLRNDQVIACEYTPLRAYKIEQTLHEIADSMRTNQYQAKPSKENCEYCPYKGICTEGSEQKC